LRRKKLVEKTDAALGLRMRSQKLWRVVQGVLVLHLLLAIVAWFTLPPRIPTHFGATGKAGAWASTSIVFWFSLVATSAGLSLMMHFITMPRAKSVWNIGEKERFLQLAPKQQAPVLELMRIFGAFSALCVNVVFLTLNLGMYLAAQGYTKGLPWWINVIIFGAPISLVLGIIPWDAAVKREVRKASRAK
jgi:uncharacterized membrane protein